MIGQSVEQPKAPFNPKLDISDKYPEIGKLEKKLTNELKNRVERNLFISSTADKDIFSVQQNPPHSQRKFPVTFFKYLVNFLFSSFISLPMSKKRKELNWWLFLFKR